MNKFLKILNVFFVALILLLVGFVLGKKYDFTYDENNEIILLKTSKNEHKIRKLIALINDQYIGNVNSDSLVDDALNTMINKLDPHSTYLSKEMSKKSDEELNGEFSGLGVQFRIFEDTITVSRVFNDSPNQKILQFGDKIIGIKEQSLLGKNAEKFNSIVAKLTDTSIPIKILRNDKELSLNLTKKMIPIPTVEGKHMITKDLGYIRLIRFSDKSAAEVHAALQDLLNQGMKTLVFDLRGNPGGVMRAAEEIADEFLREKELIVYTKDKKGERKDIFATNYGLFEHGKVYVLIDESSASSSEIVARALQDYGRGTIVGRRSFGKGLVQREVALGDDSRVRLTVANYYTPAGRSIQRPYDKGKLAYADDIYERLKNGELYSKDSIKVNEKLKFKAPSGKIVYGGGGIIPDEFVPFDVSSISNWLIYNNDSPYYEQFLYKKALEISDLFMLKNEKTYIKYFGAGILRDDFLKMMGIPLNQFDNKFSTTIDKYIKATIAKEIFGPRAYYEIWNDEDEMIKKILELEKTKS